MASNARDYAGAGGDRGWSRATADFGTYQRPLRSDEQGMKQADTIFAISSGAGLSGVCVIRVSGPAAFDAAGKLAGVLPGSRRAGLRELRDPVSGELIDKGIVIAFPGPGS